MVLRRQSPGSHHLSKPCCRPELKDLNLGGAHKGTLASFALILFGCPGPHHPRHGAEWA